MPNRRHFIAFAAAAAAVFTAPAFALGSLVDVTIVDRARSETLPTWSHRGEAWVAGRPGDRYAVRLSNRSGARVLVVLSVDGVNAVSGDTAATGQTGYVLGPWQTTEITGWRKSLTEAAAFYFTALPDSYAARTDRPDNVGVIGVAVFREKQPPVTWRQYKDKVANEAQRDAAGEKKAQARDSEGGYAGEPQASADQARSREEVAGRLQAAPSAQPMPVPAPMSKLGTGHGRSEESPAQMVRFERESATPNETIAIYYDRRENLVAMGILPPPVVARNANPFPGWPRFVPDPPTR
jgi:hypothetical protein